MQISWPRCISVAMATVLCLTRWGGGRRNVSPLRNDLYCVEWGVKLYSLTHPPSMKLIGPPGTELLQFLTGYVTLRCDLDLWPFDLGVKSRDATWVVNPGTKFEHDTTYSLVCIGWQNVIQIAVATVLVTRAAVYMRWNEHKTTPPCWKYT